MAAIDATDSVASDESSATEEKSIDGGLTERAAKMSPSAEAVPISNNINIPRRHCGSEETRFVIPKLSLGSNSSTSPNLVDGLTPHEISLKKIMDLKKLHISPAAQVNENVVSTLDVADDRRVGIHVDLTTALATEPSERVVDVIQPMETIDYKFADCELPAIKLKRTMSNMPRIVHECEIDIGSILSERLNNRTRRTTAFGKVLCSRFRCTNRLKIQHGFTPKHRIVPFCFDVLNNLAPKKANA